MNGISFTLSPHSSDHQSASEYFLLTPGISSFLKVPSAAIISAETCVPSLAEILLSCGEVYPKIFSSPLKCLSEWSLNISCSSKASSPRPCARLRYTRAANPIQGLLGYGSTGERERGGSFCLLPLKVRKACSGPRLPASLQLPLKAHGVGGRGLLEPSRDGMGTQLHSTAAL